MGLLDLRVETSILNRTLRGARVLNVYDAQNGRTYVLKLSIPPPRGDNTSSSSAEASNPASSSSVSQSWGKRLLLLESGSRIHITQYDREKDVPSGFCVKLRKHIRGRRLDKVMLLGDGGDRIIDLVFSGEGAVAAHLIVEAFSGGNVILTDAEYTILTLLRIDRTKGDGDDGIVAVRERYPAEKARKRTVVGKADFEAAMERAVAAIPDEKALQNVQGKHAKKKMQAMLIARKALAYELAIEPSFLEHAIMAAGFDPEISLSELFDQGAGPVYQNLQELEETLSNEMERGSMKGYIILNNTGNDDTAKEIYADFTPFLFMQYASKPYRQFSTFDEAVDEYFSRIESQRADTAQAKREALAFKKVDKLASGLEGQVKVFENARELSGDRARAIEANIVEVDAAVKVINSAIAASVPWDGLAKMVQDEKKNGNPIAQLIHSLQLEKNQITLRLQCKGEEVVVRDNEDTGAMSDENEDDVNGRESDRSQKSGSTLCSQQMSDKPQTKILVPIDLNLGAHANARRHYEQQKNATAKMQKAVEVTDKTIKAASKKAATEAHKLEQEAIVASIKARRVPLWFEKFYWFASSENYLVVAGRDSQQNELLVKRYMGPADIYVNADLEGASSVIVKNYKQPGSHSYDEIPQVTLEQAGAFAMCRSSAWDGKFVASAWWVRAGQVSKTVPSGEYLPSGSFFIRGKKNFLNPTQLVMGIAFMFRVDDSCIEYHKGERCIRNAEEMDEEERSQNNAQRILQTQDSVYSMSVTSGVENLDIKTATSSTQANEEQQPTIRSPPSSAELAEVVVPSSGTERTEHKSISRDSVEEDKEQQLSDSHRREQPKTTKKYLSAKERRLRKQKRNPDIEQVDSRETQAPKPVDNTKKQAGPSSSSTSASKGPTPLPRGKKHKLKKMRKKYMDQDEEERRIALELLGSKPVKEISPDEEIVEESRSSVSDDDKEEEEEVSQAVQKPRRKRVEKQEGLRLANPEGLKELERLETDCIYILDTLTALPRADDVIRYALPVCAPYNAVSNYRYRVKLMPGTTRRGKGYRAAVAVMLREAEKDLSRFKQERDSMRLTPETEGIHMMVGNVKIMARGLAEAQKSISKISKKKK